MYDDLNDMKKKLADMEHELYLANRRADEYLVELEKSKRKIKELTNRIAIMLYGESVDVEEE